MADATRQGKARSRDAARLPLPDASRPLAAQDALVLLALCVFGEARGEGAAAQRAVAQVAVNRARHPRRVFGSRRGASFEENLRRVILQPAQFSCFLASDPNFPKLLRPLDHECPAVWRGCLEAARQALAQRDLPDAFTLNSDHYFDDSLQPPAWADPAKRTVQIGRLRFYRLYLPRPSAQAGFLLHLSAPDSRALPDAESAAAPPSPRASLPPEGSCRAGAPLLRIREAASTHRHRREPAGSGSRTSPPAPHHPSQRTPRLGTHRWFSRSRGLASLSSGLGVRGAGLGSGREVRRQETEVRNRRRIGQDLCAGSADALFRRRQGAAR